MSRDQIRRAWDVLCNATQTVFVQLVCVLGGALVVFMLFLIVVGVTDIITGHNEPLYFYNAITPSAAQCRCACL